MRKMASMSQKGLCCNNAVTMATPQRFFSQPSIVYPRHITESKKYGFALFYRGEGFIFFHPPGRYTINGEGVKRDVKGQWEVIKGRRICVRMDIR